MTAHAATTPGQWTRTELENSDSWRLDVPEAVLEEFASFTRVCPEAAGDLDSFQLNSAAMPELVEFAGRVRGEVMDGCGLTWVRGLTELTPAQQRLFYLALGCGFGTPMLHYGRLYEIRDRGENYIENAVPVSMTSAGTGFHTDSSSKQTLPDVVGLLCERPAATGGDSLVSSAAQAHAWLDANAPDVLRRLYRGYIRDVVTPGIEKTHENLIRNRFPVFTRDGDSRLLFRYMRFWIERGHERAGQPLDDATLQAFDALDAALASPEHVVQFSLDRGDIIWCNNRTLAHNRTAYVDAPDQPRLLHRMWLQAGTAA